MTYLSSVARNDLRILTTTLESVSSSTTLQNDDELFFSADANTNYELDLLVIISCSNSTPDFKWAFTTLSGAEWMAGGYYDELGDSGGESAGSIVPGSSGNTTAANLISISANPVFMYISINCSYVTGSTSGTVYFRWAQNTSNVSAVNRNVSSHMIVRRAGDNPV